MRNAPQLPNNSQTQSFIEVNSASGFNAGDYVYYNNGSVGLVPNNAQTTGAFAVTATVGGTSTISGGIANVANSSVYNSGSSKMPRYAAVLTNGNIVSVFAASNYTYYPYFRIDTPAGGVVVGNTAASGNGAGYPSNQQEVGVVALSGGGFVIFCANTSGYITYSVYANDGTVVTSYQTDYPSGQSLAASIIQCVALPNGGFVLGFQASSNSLYYRIYNSVGTALYAWTSLATPFISGGNRFGMAARSNSSFCIAYASNPTVVSYYVISATNTSVTSGTISKTGASIGSSHEFVDVCTLTNDAFVIGYINYQNAAFNLLPTSNTLGSVVNVPINSGSVAIRSLTVGALASGGFIFVFQNYYFYLEWAFYNASGTLISPSTNYQQIDCIAGWQSNTTTNPTILETSGVVRVYYTNGSPDNSSYSQTHSVTQISESTYALIPYGPTQNITVATATAPVSGYARSVSTPSNAYFLAANTQTISVTSSALSGAQTPTVISSTSSYYSINSCALLNGTGFAVAWANNSTLNIALYNSSGSQIASTTIPNEYSYNTLSCVRVATLSSGNIILAWIAGNVGGSYIKGIVLSSTNLSVIAPATLLISDAYTEAYSNDFGGSWGLTGTYGNRFVICYRDTSNYAHWYTNNATFSSGTNGYLATSDGTCYNVNCGACLTAPGFWACWYPSSYSYYLRFQYYAANSSNTTYFAIGSIGNGGSVYKTTTPIIPVSANNIASMPGGYVGNNNYWTSIIAADNQTSTYTSFVEYSSYGNGTYGCSGYNFSSNGNLVAVNIGYSNSTPSSNYNYIHVSQGTSLNNTLISGQTFSGITSHNYPQTSVNPLYGDTMVMTWLDYNKYPNFLIFNTSSATYNLNLVAGVTPASTPLSVTPNNGYTFAGVSTSVAPAGGSGMIQINGAAKLNSSYNSSQPYVSFDATNPNTPYGVRGSVVGLNVNLQGS